jgi:abhydrolase domain-containing protein 14
LNVARRRFRPLARCVVRALAPAALALGALAGALTACSGSDHADRATPIAGSTTVSVDGIEVSAIVRGPAVDQSPVTVLFLHGASYTSRDWFDLGILDQVAGAGFRSIAVDLPGYGDTEGPAPKDRGRWFGHLVEGVGGAGRIVVVSPSMSGSYALAYLGEQPKAQLAGFVPVAPVGIDALRRPPGAASISTLAIWGSEDPSYTDARADHLLEMMRADPGQARTEVIAGAGHACYEDDPDAFVDLLLGFLDPTRRGN